MKNRRIKFFTLCLCIGLLAALLLTFAAPTAQAAEAGPVITQQPQGMGVEYNEYASVYIKAEGVQPLSYTWYYKLPGNADFTKSYTETREDPSFYWQMSFSDSGTQVYCVVTDGNGAQLPATL